ncbi:MAG: hypothetical protein IPK80_24600 [Nannocystis sp.]|nr:hypothetical protein [Nannocystis sp.]
MHRPSLYFLVFGLAAAPVACGDDSAGASASASSTGDSDTDTTSGGSTSGGSTSGGGACVPGASVACACPNGTMGAQVCNPDGNSFGICECAGGSSGSTSGETTGTTGEPSTGEPSTGEPSTSDASTSDASTSDATTGQPLCEDPGPEPNEEETAAIDLGMQGCMAMAGALSGVLDGAQDVDWFTYRGSWQQCVQANSDPLAAHVLMADGDLRLCAFARCLQGSTQLECPQGSMQATSPEGWTGCCGAGDLSFELNCGGTSNESADLRLRLDQAPEDACVSYSVQYSYNPS